MTTQFTLGDSPAKKLARVEVWNEIERNSNRDDFERGPHLVISGKYGGDIGVLIALGVPRKNIYAVDTNPHALANVRRKFEGVNFAVCDFAEAPQYFGKKFYSAHIDLCAPQREGALNKISALYHQVEFLAYTYLCGRERDLVPKILEIRQAGADPYDARLSHLQRYKNWKVICAWHYVSHSASHIGKPMGIALLHKKAKRAQLAQTSLLVGADWELVRKLALLEKSSHRAALLYNLRVSTVAAWQAHQTRGTYNKE